MVYRATGLQVWSESLTGDGDRPWHGEQPHAAAPAEVSEAASAFMALACAAVQCEFDSSDASPLIERKRLPAQGFRRKLISEAGRFERGEGWPSGNPALALAVARELRSFEVGLPKRPRGRPQGQNPARPLADAVVAGLPDHLEARGAHNRAATFLNPGPTPGGWTGGEPTGLSTVEGIVRVLAELAGIEQPQEAAKRAIGDIRRDERRRRARNA